MSTPPFMLTWKRALRKDATLKPHLRSTLRAISDFANGNGYCYMKMKTLGDAIGVLERQARRNVRELEGTGWLDTTPSNGGRGRAVEFQLTLPKPGHETSPNPVINPVMGDTETRSWEAAKPGHPRPAQDGVLFEPPQLEDEDLEDDDIFPPEPARKGSQEEEDHDPTGVGTPENMLASSASPIGSASSANRARPDPDPYPFAEVCEHGKYPYINGCRICDPDIPPD